MTAALCIAHLKIITESMDKNARASAKEWADDVMKTSQEKHCPVDTGAMKASGNVEITKNTDTEFYVTLSYGEKDSLDYPIWVHEIPYHHNHGSWKFLSIPFNQSVSNLIEKIAGDIKL